MDKFLAAILGNALFAFSLVGLLSVVEAQTEKSVKTVANVDLDRYKGLWYEIAKIPNRFQRKCTSGTTAQYALRNDGKIDVINRCFDKEGKVIEARGIARIVDTESNAKLKVSFVKVLGLSLFWGDYWIIGLGEDYEYAIVGTPNRKYGWILSRTPALSQEKLENIFNLLREQGYNPEEFEMTLQEK
jgi:apolipoprotein D and lipocalin family protein